jgi:hypothetical protein
MLLDKQEVSQRAKKTPKRMGIGDVHKITSHWGQILILDFVYISGTFPSDPTFNIFQNRFIQCADYQIKSQGKG